MLNLRIADITRALYLITVIFLSAGCLRENHSGCPNGLLLKFYYAAANGLPLESGFPETDRISVFIFDAEGFFVSEKQVSNVELNHYTLALPLYEGEYRFVAWAGVTDSYQLTACVPGETRLRDFILTVKKDAGNNILTPPPLLYQGQHANVNPYETPEITIGLQRITNTIRVIVHTTDPDVHPLASIEDNNGSYNHQGEIINGDKVNYFPLYSRLPDEPGTWIADFNVMRLHPGSEARLKISSGGSGRQYDEKLVSDLLNANPYIDFDSDHDFTIEITFDEYYLPVSILVNGWEIITEETG